MIIPESSGKIKPEGLEEISLDEVEKYYPQNGNAQNPNRKRMFWDQNKRDILTAVIVILVGTGSYGLGRLSKIESTREPVKIIQSETPSVSASPSPIPSVAPVLIKKTVTSPASASAVLAAPKIQAGMLVGSKTGDKYHFPWCSGAQRIKDENKVWFASYDEAKKAGYTAAANCKGLQ